VLFVDVPKVEIKISHRGLTGIAHGFDVLDNCRAGKCQPTSVIFDGESKILHKPKNSLARASYTKQMLSGGVGQGVGERRTFSMDPDE
jgi:hypothetical protein